jgi:WD40 repeat protein
MEWYYLKHLCRSDASVSFEDQGSVALDFSEDGKLLAYTLNKILIRDVRSKEVIEKLEFAASSLEFVPKQNLLATANHDACILWNTSTWSPLKTLPNAIHPIAFSPDGTKMLSGTKTGYRLWDTKSWKPLAECSIPHRNGGTFNGEKINRHVGFSSDGSIVMTGAEKGNQKFQLWNGHNLDPIPIEGALGENSSVSASFLGKGPYLLTGSMLGDVTLWNVLNGEKIQSKQGAHLGFVTDISLSNDGMHFLTVSSDRTLQVWDLNRFEPIKLLRGHHGEIWTAGWSPDNLTIASGAFDGTTQLWNAHLEDEEYSIETGIIGYNYEPDGESLVGFFDQDDWLVRWDFESSPKSLFSEIDPMQTTGIQERHISKHDYKFAIGRTNGMIEIWDRKTGQLEFEKQYASSEMNRIIASPEKGVWAVSTEQRLFSFSQTHPENVTEFKGPIHDVRLLEYSPDGRLLAAVGNEQQVFVWKIGHPDQTKSLSLSIPDSIGSLQFSNKGDLIAAGTVNSNRIYLWNVPDFDLYAELEGHIQGVNSIVFSLDDQTIITTSLDRNIIFWHVPTRQEMLTLFNDRPVMNLRISPDDQSFVGIELDIHAGDHRTRVWHAPRP